MCGRFSLTTSRVDLARELEVTIEAVPSDLAPRWNIAPSQPVLALRQQSGLRLDFLEWGFVPERAGGGGDRRLINARSETLDRRPTFRDAFRERRCLVAADGFYEWRESRSKRGPKTPFFIRLRSGGVFTFAGLWSRRRVPGKPERLTCVIVTCEPNELLAEVHDRMPAIVSQENRNAWLDPDHRDPESLRALLRSHPAEPMEMYPVSRHVNSPDHDDPACVKPAPDDDGPSPDVSPPRLFH